ncbi:MAG: hypothetical protein ACRDZR_06725 [Acidimicrobiales bacterium]
MADEGSAPERVLIDPSLLLQARTLDWMEASPDLFVASSAFKSQLAEGQIGPGSRLLPPEEPYTAEINRDRVLALLEEVATFSHFEVELDETHSAITQSLLALGDPSGIVYADEWVFLSAHSVMFSAVRQPLDALRHAGAVVVEYGRRVLDEALTVVIPTSHRDRYAPTELFARGAMKWLVLGGATGTAGAVGGVLGALTPLAGVPLVRGFDP